MKNTLQLGIVGAGGFATFAAKAFLKISGVRIVAVTDINFAAARQLAQEVQAEVHVDLPTMLQDPRIELVYLATPPFLHYSQAKQALEAGKHVICEKPAALRTQQAEELSEYALQHRLLYIVNLMQRYNPLYGLVKTIVEKKWLGDFVHGFFENYASDEKLVPAHWFWDRDQSGGIFIEHGVHFFDLFSGWLGTGQLHNALQQFRPGTNPTIIDRVQATVLYQDGLVNFYHGFNQPKLLDRQEMRLQFDRGDITLYEWVPVKIRLHGLLLNEQIAQLQTWPPNAAVVYHTDPTKPGQQATGKFRELHYDALITLQAGDPADKMARYEQLLISMLTDQWQWLQDSTHVRLIDERNAVESLRIAEAATVMADRDIPN